MVAVGNVYGKPLPNEGGKSEVTFDTLAEAEDYLDMLENRYPEETACETFYLDLGGDSRWMPVT